MYPRHRFSIQRSRLEVGGARVRLPEDAGVKKSAFFVAMMVFGISLMIWAGVYSLRARKLKAQQAQANHIVLTKDGAANLGDGAGSSGETTAQDIPLKGKPAPAFTLVTLDGKKVSLSDYKGRPVVVNFWATWCAPCKLEMPWFEEFRQKYQAQGFEILGIAEDDAGKDEIAKTAKKVAVTYPILLTDGKVAPAYGGVDMLPTSFYIDRKGLVTTETIGLASKDEVEANIKKLLGPDGASTASLSSALPVGPGR
jgi:thiol-disulfide isomerase/thioredoxin